MKYRVEDIPLEGTTLKGELEPDWLGRNLEGEEHLDLSAVTPIVYRVSLVRGKLRSQCVAPYIPASA